MIKFVTIIMLVFSTLVACSSTKQASIPSPDIYEKPIMVGTEDQYSQKFVEKIWSDVQQRTEKEEAHLSQIITVRVHEDKRFFVCQSIKNSVGDIFYIYDINGDFVRQKILKSNQVVRSLDDFLFGTDESSQ